MPRSKTTVLATGYEPHDGPSMLCTGGARRTALGLAALLPLWIEPRRVA